MIYQGVLLHLDDVPDSQGDIFGGAVGTVNSFDNSGTMVKVDVEFDGSSIGYAAISFDHDKVIYTLYFYIQHEKNIDIFEQLTPVMGGRALNKAGNRIIEFVVDSVSLAARPSDKRLLELAQCKAA